MESKATAPAKAPLPYFTGLSQNKDVYRGAQYWAILDQEYKVVADIEGDMSPEAKATAEFLVRACNCHEDLVAALAVSGNLLRGRLVEETPGSGDQQQLAWVLDVVHSALKKAYEHAA